MKKALALVYCIGLAACSTEYAATDNAPPPDGAFSFVVIGDIPYSTEDENLLAEAVPLIKAGDYPFVIHVGDYKGGKTPCTTEHDDRFQALIDALAPTPVIYTPGDNEWTDCDRNKDETTGKPHSDLARLAVVRERFFAEPPLTPKAFEFERQSSQVENASWRHDGIRFATLHVVATANGRDWVTGDPLDAAKAAIEAREAANLDWLAHVVDLAKEEKASALVVAMQADPVADSQDANAERCVGVSDHEESCDAFIDLRIALKDAATTFGGPVLLIHGDSAPFTLDQTFSGDEAANLWRLNAAGDAGVGIAGDFYGTRDVTLVVVDTKGAPPFTARGLVTGKTPKTTAEFR
jgi:hypothetical protein